MKTSLVLKGIEIAGVKIGEVAVTHECSATEAIKLMMGGKDFVKSFIKDIPEMASDLKKAYDVVEAINNDVVAEDVVADNSIVDKYIDMVNTCNSKREINQVLIQAIDDEDLDDLADINKIRDQIKTQLRIIEEKAESVETNLKQMSITYKYCIQAIKNATCEDEIDEVIDYARMQMGSADYATIVYTAIQRKQEIGVCQPFMQ